MAAALTFFFGHWYLSLFVQTFFLHRYAAHKLFTMNKFWERFFYILTYIAQGSSYLVPRGYAILHRWHHAFSDTARDPHSPLFAKNIFHMMWKTKDIYNAVVNKKMEVEEQFEYNYPEWAALDALGNSWISRIFWITAYITFYVVGFFYWNIHWGFFFLLPLHFVMGPLHGAIVNWCGHKYGYQNFDNHDDSKNTLVFDFLTMGELFQNNHHKRPTMVNFGAKWFEIDPTYFVVKCLKKVGIIKLKKFNE
jgi:stearoyl-CoA desaturase (delta-9 desaturase)